MSGSAWLVVSLAFAVIAILSGVSVLLSVAASAEHQGRIDSFKQGCIEQGGHLYSPDIILCLTADGRLVEVYP